MSQKLYKEKLSSSGLTLADAKRLHFRYLSGKEAHRLTAKHGQPFREASFVLPYHDAEGREVDFWRLRRLAEPTVKGFSKRAANQRYTQALDSPPRAYFPPLLEVPWAEVLADPTIPVFVTEGELKAAAGCKFLREPVLALGGVWNWMSSKHQQPLIPDLTEVAWDGRVVYLVFDSDTATNPKVRQALNAFSRVLSQRGALVHLATLPAVPGPDGKLLKTGLDDFLVLRGAEEFEQLATLSEPYALSRVLWELNDLVTWVRHPAMVVELETDQLMSVQQFRDNYAPYRFHREDSKGKLVETAAATEWVKWAHRAEVYQVSYRPGEDKVVHDQGGRPLYNLWPGWGVEPVKGDVSPWLELLDYALAGMNRAERRWLERWVAYQFQHPGVKIYSAVLMWGPTHGTGKSLMGVTLKKIFGRNGSVVEQDQLASGYNKWAENKQFIMGDEIVGVEKRKEADHIKNLVTREEVEINGKYMPTYYLADVANWYLTSNHPDALVLEDTDRRFFVWRFPDTPLTEEFYRRYDEWLHGDGPSHLFHHLLHQVDLGDFNPKAPPPVTEHKVDMIYQGKTDLAAWVADLKRDPDAVLRLDQVPVTGDLFEVKTLVALAEAAGVRVFSANALARELTSAGFPKSEVVTLPGRPSVRVRPVRNPQAWQAQDLSAWRAHYEQTQGAEAPRSKGRGRGTETEDKPKRKRKF